MSARSSNPDAPQLLAPGAIIWKRDQTVPLLSSESDQPVEVSRADGKRAQKLVMDLGKSMSIKGELNGSEDALGVHARVRQVAVGRQNAQQRIRDLIYSSDQPIEAAVPIDRCLAVRRVPPLSLLRSLLDFGRL
jgi:hypothetical protein